jgi:hypothetical protein
MSSAETNRSCKAEGKAIMSHDTVTCPANDEIDEAALERIAGGRRFSADYASASTLHAQSYSAQSFSAQMRPTQHAMLAQPPRGAYAQSMNGRIPGGR